MKQVADSDEPGETGQRRVTKELFSYLDSRAKASGS
jgi:hypothetical protein